MSVFFITEREIERSSKRRAKGHWPLPGRPHTTEEEDQPEPRRSGERSTVSRSHSLLLY